MFKRWSTSQRHLNCTLSLYKTIVQHKHCTFGTVWPDTTTTFVCNLVCHLKSRRPTQNEHTFALFSLSFILSFFFFFLLRSPSISFLYIISLCLGYWCHWIEKEKNCLGLKVHCSAIFMFCLKRLVLKQHILIWFNEFLNCFQTLKWQPIHFQFCFVFYSII